MEIKSVHLLSIIDDKFIFYYVILKYSIKDLTDTISKKVPKILLNNLLSIL